MHLLLYLSLSFEITPSWRGSKLIGGYSGPERVVTVGVTD